MIALSLLRSSYHSSNSYLSLLTSIQREIHTNLPLNLLVALRFQIHSHPIFQIHNYGAAVPPQFIHTTRLAHVKHVLCTVDFGLGIQSFPKARRILSVSRFRTGFEPYIGLGARLAAARALLSDQRGNHGRCYEGNQELVDSTSNSINGQSWELLFADTFSSLLLWNDHK